MPVACERNEENTKKLRFARKRNEENSKNSVSLASDGQKLSKTARRLCFFLKRLTFKIKKQ